MPGQGKVGGFQEPPSGFILTNQPNGHGTMLAMAALGGGGEAMVRRSSSK